MSRSSPRRAKNSSQVDAGGNPPVPHSAKPELPSRHFRLNWSNWRPGAFAIGLGVVFFAVDLWGILHHVMWRDEWYGWLASRYVPTFGELNELRGHQGWPIGWTVCTWLVCQCGGFPWGPKVFQATVASGSVYLLARFSRLPRIQVVLLAFSYFLWYEYGTIMRDYGCEVFLIMAACALFTSHRRRPIALGVTFALLFLMQPFGTPIGVLIGGTYLS